MLSDFAVHYPALFKKVKKFPSFSFFKIFTSTTKMFCTILFICTPLFMYPHKMYISGLHFPIKADSDFHNIQ